MKICVSSYSYAQYTRAGKMNTLDCVIKAAEMGFDGIEFTDLPGDTKEARLALAAELRAKADELGIDIVAYTVSANLYQPTAVLLDAEVARLRAQVDVAAALGAKLMRHDACWKLEKTGDARSFDRMLPTIAEGARRVTEYAAAKGIATCSENHGRIAQDSDRMERLFNAVAHDNYSLLIDMGNFTGVGEKPWDAISRLAPYAIHVHIKDLIIREEPFEGGRMTRNGGYTKPICAGEGDVDIKRCLSILKAAGYAGAVSIEYEAAEDCIEGIRRGAENVRRILSELEW